MKLFSLDFLTGVCYNSIMKENFCNVITHYDLLIDENNDPVYDDVRLQEHMNKWDGEVFIETVLKTPYDVLEIGVGTGRLALKIAPFCRSFTGIDISKKTIERASYNLRDIPNVYLLHGDFLTHSFLGTFDVIYSSLTFLHIKEKQKAFTKISDLLKDNGRFILSIDKNQTAILDYGSRKIQLYPDDREHTEQFITNASLTILQRLETEFAYIYITQKSITPKF